jgi:hypothetical protein
MFKPNSQLKNYLLENHIVLDEYFTADTICSALTKMSGFKNLIEDTNNNIIVLTPKLEIIFNMSIIYKPHLFEACLPEIIRAPDDTNRCLREQNIKRNLSLLGSGTVENENFGSSLIYLDQTSVFYLYHHVKKLMQTHKIVFPWPELLDIFTDFCTTDQANFTRKANTDIIEIKETSSIAHLVPFKYFHIEQCETILKRITKYLGRSPFHTYSCPYFKKKLFPNPMFDDVISFVEAKIDETIMLPSFCPSLQF